MGLTQNDKAIIEKARSVGTTALAVALNDAQSAYLAALIASDLGFLPKIPSLATPPPFFETQPIDSLALPGTDFWKLMERLADLDRDVVTYFSCLAALHKARLKYARILSTQPIPTMDQVGPRGLLQYGSMPPKALAGFLLWRKWIYDIDNRAAQETGYLFEPIIALSMGGVPVSATKSPVRRREDPNKGRQVDCLSEDRAYEFKLRVTIAASGQGRWREELDFPADCRASGFTPVLIVFDPTPNSKLTDLRKAFLAQSGEVYVGKDAWKHLDAKAGKTMATFLAKYVRQPVEALLKEVAADRLPELNLAMDAGSLRITVDGTLVVCRRGPPNASLAEPNELPDDVDEAISPP
jgi:hypothetical protein